MSTISENKTIKSNAYLLIIIGKKIPCEMGWRDGADISV